MKLGDIKAEALKLMFINLDQDIDAGSLADLNYDETYASYLVAMPGSIRRALKIVAGKYKLGVKSAELTAEAPGKFLTRYTLPADCLKVARVIKQTGDCVRNTFDWQQEGKALLLPTLHRETDSYRLVYYPKAPDISGIEDEKELDVPEEVAEMIPYYIKGELYEDDEPGSAAQARNLFEQWVEGLEDPEEANPMIEMVYGWSQ